MEKKNQVVVDIGETYYMTRLSFTFDNVEDTNAFVKKALEEGYVVNIHLPKPEEVA